MFEVGNIVSYIHEDTDAVKETGYYPPIGTIGKVTEDDNEHHIRVQWPDGTTKGDGIWWCHYNNVRLIPSWIPSGVFNNLAKCPFCGQNKHTLNKASAWAYCPYCGERIQQK